MCNQVPSKILRENRESSENLERTHHCIDDRFYGSPLLFAGRDKTGMNQARRPA